MTTKEDFTTRVRTQVFTLYQTHIALQRSVEDLQNEVAALGGAAAIYGAGGADFPTEAQGDGFDYDDMVAAFQALDSIVAAPTAPQEAAMIKARKD